MKLIKIICFLFCTIYFSYIGIADTTCFILAENNQIIKQEGECTKRYSPCSTFKIAISLMGYDSGILIDEIHPEWEYKDEYVDWVEIWKQAHHPTLWLKTSSVWYSQLITQKLAIKQFSDYVQKFQYGNQDISGDKRKNNGLTHSWLLSSLKISPFEQIDFIQKLTKNKLPVRHKAQNMTKNIMFVETLKNDWKLYGKTGGGKQIGWFVGFLTKKDKTMEFVYMMNYDEKQKTFLGSKAKAALKAKLASILTKNPSSEN